MYYHSPFIIAKPAAKNTSYTIQLRFRNINSPVRRRCDTDNPLGLPVYKIIIAVKVFYHQTRKVGCKTFVKPYITPCTTGYLITKPLMSQFVRYKIPVKIPHKRNRGMLNPFVYVTLGMSILFVCERISPKKTFIQVHYREGCCQLIQRSILVFRINIIYNRERIRSRTCLLRVYTIFGNRYSYKVSRYRIL